ncbi:MAG: hypothetical protein LBB26_02105 [Puniceicoccales bacterium]|nr:hypothetical protein [Puniceicoccales bacterium]
MHPRKGEVRFGAMATEKQHQCWVTVVREEGTDDGIAKSKGGTPTSPNGATCNHRKRKLDFWPECKVYSVVASLGNFAA